MYVCTYACLYEWVDGCMHECMYVCMYTHCLVHFHVYAANPKPAEAKLVAARMGIRRLNPGTFDSVILA